MRLKLPCPHLSRYSTPPDLRGRQAFFSRTAACDPVCPHADADEAGYPSAGRGRAVSSRAEHSRSGFHSQRVLRRHIRRSLLLWRRNLLRFAAPTSQARCTRPAAAMTSTSRCIAWCFAAASQMFSALLGLRRNWWTSPGSIGLSDARLHTQSAGSADHAGPLPDGCYRMLRARR